MLKEHASVIRRLTILGDIGVVTLSFFLGYFLRNRIRDIYPLAAYLQVLPLVIFVYIYFLYVCGVYRSHRTAYILEILSVVFKAAVFGFFIFASSAYIFKITYISRVFIVFVFAIAAILLSLEKIILAFIFRYVRKKGFNYRSVLIIGTGSRAQRFMELVRQHEEWGLKIIGIIDADKAKAGEIIAGHKVLGSFEDIDSIVHNNVVDEVVFIVPRSWLGRIEEVIHFLETEGLRIHLAVDYFELQFSKAKQTDFHGFPLLTFESAPDKLWHLLIKRVFDIMVSALGLLALSAVFGVVAIAVKATSSGPVFFRQERCGLNGRRFILYKFRTMVRDAEVQLGKLRAYNEMDGPVFKIARDPRLTAAGRFLRKTSLDELPQLWNVFRGDMSLIGPRPPIPAEVEKYASWHRRRLSMRPGITCLWQVNGRSKITDFNKWMKLDLEYIDNWSLWLDLKIFLKTVPVVMFGIGAK